MAKDPRSPTAPDTISDKDALLFHSRGRPGKLAIVATKPMATQRDLSLAYSPGVAAPVLAIAKDPSLAYDYTTRGNMVAVITNGTAILGLGDLGALAAKPVMEGKAALFKRFADLDSIDLEIDTHDVDAFIQRISEVRGVPKESLEGYRGMNILSPDGTSVLAYYDMILSGFLGNDPVPAQIGRAHV